ncbi:MAG: ATP-binding protein [Planctomycetes bacterium]|nr:ATP-binding protein [Planctomycetota bacterium]
MSTSAEFHLTSYEKFRARGLEAYRGGDRNSARECLLKSAEHLFEAAAQSRGRLREVRARRARELMGLARDIDLQAGATLGGRSVESDGCVPGDDRASFAIAERPAVGFDDIAGLEEVKEELRLKIIYPFQHSETAARFGVQPGGGVLLYGPPGTGKTLLARAVAGETQCAFFTVKPSDILSKWVGEAEQNLQRLFAEARRSAPSVIFIDEIDALAPRRSEALSSVMARLVPQLLTELEGFSGRTEPILFLGATNAPWALDPAILRPGRFDERIYVGMPDRPAVRRILEIHLQGRPLAPDVDLEELADRLQGFSGADLRGVCRKAADDAFLTSIRGGQLRPVDRERLLRAAAETSPSVDAAMAQKYQGYRDRSEARR